VPLHGSAIQKGVIMTGSKLRRPLLVLAALAVLATAIAAPAQAQGTTLSTKNFKLEPQTLIPEGQVASLSMTVEYKFSATQSPLGSAQNQAVTITFTPQNCPSEVLIVGPKTKIVTVRPEGQAPTGNSAGGGSVDASFSVTVTRDAPGLKTISCDMVISGSELAANVAPAPPDITESFSLIADYYSLVQAKVASKVKQAGPQKNVPFEIEISNFGNARTQVSFELASEPNGKRWEAVLPDNLILDSPTGGGEGKTSDTATFTIATTYKTGWNNEQGSYQIIMKPTSADQPDKQGNPISANVLVRVRGVYVPSLEPIVLLGAVIGLALVARLSRRE